MEHHQQGIHYHVESHRAQFVSLRFLITLALADIPKHHGIQYHFYADDGQLYIVFDFPTDDNPHTLAIATKTIEVCVNDMRLCLAIHMMLCNADKTELILFASYQIDIPGVQIGSKEIIPSQIARNIGLVMDTGLTFSTHVGNVVSAAFSSQEHCKHL